ncbi:MAG: isochorismatase family protein [Solirubrobacteraceae bacterium]
MPGSGARRPLGRCPCLLVIDFTLAFTSPASPLACDADAAVAACGELLEAARSAGVFVLFTTVAYGEADLVTASAFVAKAPALAALRVGSEWTRVDRRINPNEGEVVMRKLWASAFFGTPLASTLVARGCDSVVLAGASTSGCVRATAVDALQHGFRVAVCEDAVADRSAASHEASLVDIDAKYGDVVGLDGARARLFAANRGAETPGEVVSS